MLNNLSDNQKRTLALAAIALLALACLCGTLAFTVDMVPANNVLSFGGVKVRVCEYTLNERGEEIPFEADEHGDYPDTKAGGSDISRIVRTPARSLSTFALVCAWRRWHPTVRVRMPRATLPFT